ncbi:hypothetical protein F3Y22_tig00110187pilonHSYRG00040 [Hibiscus syriacus]|uniref:Uncharacterized protein n=1 Tax=Hibiscus syriacus TaxID=106335 RepID=A0A6A3BH68_HIBSY|nr:ribonuclease 1-like [Hibiscus syriacus]KAE8714788.1 hypothetical protein F3Y22_tig00110187pilonHSYRG00040 [Hibiscus syriacus]
MDMKQILAFAAAVVASLVVSAQGADFAFYKLSLRWPTTLCIAAPQTCKSPIPDTFTIHGLWPTFKDDKNVPPYNPLTNKCNPNPMPATNIVAELQPIRGRLEKKWPDLIKGYRNEDLWEIQWLHHGMCSDYPRDPLIYYTSALILAENSKYDPLKVLGVQPSQTPYDIDTLLDNVKRTVGFYPQISCSMPIKGKQLYLKEIRFCFKRAMPPYQLQNCPDDMDNLCRSVPPLQRTVMIPPPITTNSGLNVTWELLASA